jgi:hypothetical protein
LQEFRTISCPAPFPIVEKWGPGCRVRVEYKDDRVNGNDFFWINNSMLGNFVEILFLSRSFIAGKDGIPEDISKINLRTGFHSWISVDSKKFSGFSLWGEMWSELSYNSSNFGKKGNKKYGIIVLQPKIGLKFKSLLQVYCKPDLMVDIGGKEWNKEPWLNNIKIGPGIRT